MRKPVVCLLLCNLFALQSSVGFASDPKPTPQPTPLQEHMQNPYFNPTEPTSVKGYKAGEVAAYLASKQLVWRPGMTADESAMQKKLQPKPVRKKSDAASALVLSATAAPFMPMNVYEPDQRFVADQSQGAARMVGRLVFQQSDGYWYSCTATLVRTPDVDTSDRVLTAGHCVYENASGSTRSVSSNWWQSATFLAAYSNDTPFDTASVVAVANNPGYLTQSASDYQNDWAVLKINKRLGDVLGRMKIQAVEPADYFGTKYQSQFGSVNLVAYSGDHYLSSAGAHLNCRLRSATYWAQYGGGSGPGPVNALHDCDMTEGASGGSIYTTVSGEPMVVAINNAEYIMYGPDGKVTEDTTNPWNPHNSNIAVPTADPAAALEAMVKADTNPNPPYPGPSGGGGSTPWYATSGAIAGWTIGGACVLGTIAACCVYQAKKHSHR